MWTKAQIYMMNGIGVYKETKKGKSYAKSDPEVGVVGNWSFVLGKFVLALSVIILRLIIALGDRLSIDRLSSLSKTSLVYGGGTAS